MSKYTRSAENNWMSFCCWQNSIFLLLEKIEILSNLAAKEMLLFIVHSNQFSVIKIRNWIRHFFEIKFAGLIFFNAQNDITSLRHDDEFNKHLFNLGQDC
jgi:hypothetical protein